MIVKIQNRRGQYLDYDPSKLLPGEFAIVQMGDPNTATGNGIYLAITSGNVVRLATIEEIQAYTQHCEDIYQATVQDAEQLLNIAKSMLANYDGGLVVVNSVSSMTNQNALYLYSGSGQYENYVYRYDSDQQTFIPIVEFGSVIDASLTEHKFSESLKTKTLKEYVVPEMYGAKGDGTTNDTAAIQLCIDSNPGKTIVFSKNYLVSAPIQTSATDVDKVMLVGINGSKITAASNFTGLFVIDLCGKGTRTGIQNTKNITGIDGLIIDTNGRCGGVLVENCCEARISNCSIINLGAYVGLQIDKPSESNGVNSSDAYIDNIIVVGETSNVTGCTGLVINGHDNDIHNVRTNYVNVGIVINGSHNRIANAHPLRGASDENFTIYETSKAFVINNNFIYLTDCYSDNFAVGIDVAKAGAIFFLTNFTLLWWENLATVHTFIKLEDDTEATSANKIFWGHVNGADLLFKTSGTNVGIDGTFHANTYIRNSNCFTNVYIDGTSISATDALLDKRLTTNKIIDYNYTAIEVSDLLSLNEGTCGRVRFTAAVSPTGTAGIYIYQCVGDSTRKIITAYYPSTKKTYINSYTGSWTGWMELANQSDVATNTANIATNTASIGTLNTGLTALTGKVVKTTLSTTQTYANATSGTYNYQAISGLSDYNVVLVLVDCGNIRQWLTFVNGDTTPLYLWDYSGTNAIRCGVYVDWTNNRVYIRYLQATGNYTSQHVSFSQVVGFIKQ